MVNCIFFFDLLILVFWKTKVCDIFIYCLRIKAHFSTAPFRHLVSNDIYIFFLCGKMIIIPRMIKSQLNLWTNNSGLVLFCSNQWKWTSASWFVFRIFVMKMLTVRNVCVNICVIYVIHTQSNHTHTHIQRWVHSCTVRNKTYKNCYLHFFRFFNHTEERLWRKET